MGALERLRVGLSINLNRLSKLTIQRWKYRRGDGYMAEEYWRDRLRKHGTSLRGVGNEGMSEEDNRLSYESSFKELIDLLESSQVSLAGKKVLEIGVGNGFWTERLWESAASWDAQDITDALFPALQERFPEVRFHHADVCVSVPWGGFEVILMIEVLEHIVRTEDMRRALSNMAGAMRKGGVLIMGPIAEKPGRSLFHVRFWSVDEVLDLLPGFRAIVSGPFRGGKLILAFKEEERLMGAEHGPQ